MLAGLLVLAVVAAVTTCAVKTYQWITSAPGADKQDALSRFRRTVYVRIESENLFCSTCRNAPATSTGYCSARCRDFDLGRQPLA